jgi:hypothetical protein
MSFLADQMKKMIRCLSIAALLMGGGTEVESSFLRRWCKESEISSSERFSDIGPCVTPNLRISTEKQAMPSVSSAPTVSKVDRAPSGMIVRVEFRNGISLKIN